MPKILALEWDNREARLLVASVRGGEVTIDDAFAAPDLTEEGGRQDAAKVGEKIAAALAARRISGVETLVAVGRSSIELKRLSLPPAPDEDLPDLVRFQAEREFTSLSDESPLDFLPLTTDPQQARVVLAAAVTADLVEQINTTCQQADLKPRRLVLRPCAAASLLRRRTKPDEPAAVRLLVDLLADEVDLTVLDGDQVILLRTARMSGAVADDTTNIAPLVAEIRRTIAAAQNQLAGRGLEQVYLCSGADQYAALAERIQQSLGIPTRRFDPFDGVRKKAALSADLPPHAGRFAPLVGMVLDEADRVAPGIDFLNPRRRPKPASRRRTYTLTGAAVAAVALLAGGWLYYQSYLMNDEIALLQKQIGQQRQLLDKQADVSKTVAEIDKWAAGDILWLDELRELSAEFPDAQQAMLTELRINPHADGGEIQLEGLVRDTSVVDTLETGLRDDVHVVEGQGAQQETDPDHYRWNFSSVVVTKGRGEALPEEQN